MKRIVRLTESDLTRIVRRVINEGTEPPFKELNFPNYNMRFRYDPKNDYIEVSGTIKSTNRYLKQQSHSASQGSDGLMKYILHGWGMASQFDTEIGRAITSALDNFKEEIAQYKKKNPIQIK